MNQTALISVLRRVNRNFRTMFHLHLAAVGTIAFSLLIAGLFLILFANVNAVIETWKKDFRVVAYLQKGISSGQGTALQEKVSRLDGVGSVTYVSREAAMKRLREQMKHRSSLLEGLRENPLPASLEIEPATSDPDETRIGHLVKTLEGLPGVSSVEYARAWLRRFTGFVSFFRLATLVIATVIFATTVFICSNTIRLTLYARREEVAIMKIVGATDAFIKAPYYIQNLLEGLLGGLLAVGILFGTYTFFAAKLAGQDALLSIATIRFLSAVEMAGLMVSGMAMAWLGCHLSLNRFAE